MMKLANLSKIFLILILIFCTVQTTIACCAGERLRVFPSSDYISQNPIFLLEFSNIKSNLRNYSRVYLKDQKGKVINLEVIEGYGKGAVNKKNPSYDLQNRFVLLKPVKKLARNSVVSIVIESGQKLNDRMKRNLDHLHKKTWKVKLKTDKRDPTLGSKIIGKYYGGFNSSAPGHNIQFELETSDNYQYIASFPPNYTDEKKLKYPKQPEMLVELIDEEGTKNIFPLRGGKFFLASGTCYRNFNLPSRVIEDENKDFSFNVRLMDYSGNISKDTRLLKFKLINKKKPKKEKMTVNGVDYFIERGNCNEIDGPAKLRLDGTSWENIGHEKNCTYIDVYLAKNVFRNKERNSENKVVDNKARTTNLLEQNIPNPVFENTIIKYKLSSNARSPLLTLTDISGRVVRSISLDRTKKQITLNVKELLAGIYFYSLVVGEEIVETKKMVVE